MWSRINRCVLCEALSPGPLCERCIGLMQANQPACIQCAEPLSSHHAQLCGYCLRHGRSVSRTFSPLLYDFPLDSLIQGLKFSQRCAYARLLVDLSAPYFLSQIIDFKYDFIIPVPLHPVRFLQRGFNQADLLSRQLAILIDTPVKRLLRRIQHKRPQAALTLAERRVNLVGGFCVTVPERPIMQHQRLLLVDDVITTGATVDAAAAALVQAYSVPVDVWSVARTP